MYDLDLNGNNVVYRNNTNAQQFMYWRNFLKENKSFCFYPFLALVDNIDSTCICPKSRKVITQLKDITNWHTDPDYGKLREKMIAGELNPEHCSDCYAREAEGQESTRQYETLEWTERIHATSIDDFISVKTPMYYEIRPSNKCNIMCRTCDDGHSHLIEKEWKKYGEIPLVEWRFTNTVWDKIDFTNIEKIYVGGGEPTIITEFYDFLRKCIAEGKTDFELAIGTNGMKFSNTLVELLDQFSKVVLSFSYDGYKKVNDYIRWGSDFDTVVANAQMLQSRGHKIALQSVFSMYSITRMYEVFEFYDREYPMSGLLVQVGAGQDDTFMPFNHPCPDLVLESMQRCQQTKTYYANGRSIKSMIDLIIDHYSKPDYKVDVELLRKFYEFNDKLDRYRNSQLDDYIPELAEARQLYGV
jgi:organic radical activating enzyme